MCVCVCVCVFLGERADVNEGVKWRKGVQKKKLIICCCFFIHDLSLNCVLHRCIM